MRILLFNIKRALRSRAFILMLAVYAAAIFASSLPEASGTTPPAGVYCEDMSAAAQRITAHLTKNGFLIRDSEESLRREIEQGTLDCGIILPEGLSQRIETLDTKGCIKIVTGPLSLTPQLYQSHAAAALYRECAPFLAAKQLDGLPASELTEEYERRFESGYAFSFELVTSDGAVPTKANDTALLMGAVSLLLFALLMSTNTGSVQNDLLLRLGAFRTLTLVLLPDVLTRSLFAAAAGSIALLLAGAPQLIGALIAYSLVLSALMLLLPTLMPEPRDRHILSAVLLIAALALCPIFGDLTLFSPLLEKARYLLPPWWFYCAVRNCGVWLVFGVLALLLACAAVCARWYWLGKYVIKSKSTR